MEEGRNTKRWSSSRQLLVLTGVSLHLRSKPPISLGAISAECFPELLKIPPAEGTLPTSPLTAAILMKENAAGLKVEVWRCDRCT